MNKQLNIILIANGSLIATTILSSYLLSSTLVNADDAISNASVTIPVSCTMSGSGMSSHSASIINGTYQADIGTTTVNVVCNDSSGFSIYATGFTGETIGQTNSNKLVGTAASGNATIATGTATSTGNPDVSNWAMKLSTDSSATYPVTITNGFDSYHGVPNGYDKVASSTSGTDAGQAATGASLTTTYAAYISKTQPADTYSGKVKYTLVHPSNGTSPSPSAPGVTDLVVVTPPTKTTYNDGETIDPAGIVVKAYYQDGTEWGTVPVNNISVNPSIATISKTCEELNTTKGTITGVNTDSIMFPIRQATNSQLIYYNEDSGSEIIYNVPSNVKVAVNKYAQNEREISVGFVFASSEPFSISYTINGVQYVDQIGMYPDQASGLGPNVLYTTHPGWWAYTRAWETNKVHLNATQINNYMTLGYNKYPHSSILGYVMVYGETTCNKQPVVLSWENPLTGEIVTTTYDIIIRPN